MRFLWLFLPVFGLAQDAPPKVPGNAETLHYSVNWPSGLSLGEATLTASRGAERVEFTFVLDASVPGFAVQERANSKATPAFCSVEFEKSFTRGQRKAEEKLEFDTAKMSVTRTTKGGGQSKVSTPQCAKDALAFLHFLRKELAAGRLPSKQKVFYGSGYDTHVQFTGNERILLGGEPVETEKILLTIKGPASENTAEILFAKDAARTPLLVRVPLSLGKFSMEIAR